MNLLSIGPVAGMGIAFCAIVAVLLAASLIFSMRLKGGGAARMKAAIAAHFRPTNIAYMALFTALAFVVTFLEFPIFPAANFLKLDFANVFFMIEGFIFGPIEAVFSIGVKELLCLAKSTSGGVGELANFLMSTAYILIPAFLYRFKKGKWWVALYLLFACILQIGVSVVVNRFINFPFYGVMFGFDGAALFKSLWPFVIYFNLIKSVAVSLVVFLLYKPLSRLIKATAERVSRRKRA